MSLSNKRKEEKKHKENNKQGKKEKKKHSATSQQGQNAHIQFLISDGMCGRIHVQAKATLRQSS